MPDSCTPSQAYTLGVASEALDVVNRWRAANFEREAVTAVLAGDVEWIVPGAGGTTTLRGVDEVLAWYERGGVADEEAPEDQGGADAFDISEERGELEDFGDGRVGSVNRVIYTAKDSGEIAEVKTARLMYTVRNGKIARYELENLEVSETEGPTTE